MLKAIVKNVQMDEELAQVICFAKDSLCNATIELRFTNTVGDFVNVIVTWDNTTEDSPSDAVQKFDIDVCDLGYDVEWVEE